MSNWYIFLRPYLPLILINKLLLGAELWNVEVDCCEANYLSGFSFKVAKSNLFFYFQRARPMMLAFWGVPYCWKHYKIIATLLMESPFASMVIQPTHKENIFKVLINTTTWQMRNKHSTKQWAECVSLLSGYLEKLLNTLPLSTSKRTWKSVYLKLELCTRPPLCFAMHWLAYMAQPQVHLWSWTHQCWKNTFRFRPAKDSLTWKNFTPLLKTAKYSINLPLVPTLSCANLLSLPVLG